MTNSAQRKTGSQWQKFFLELQGVLQEIASCSATDSARIYNFFEPITISTPKSKQLILLQRKWVVYLLMLVRESDAAQQQVKSHIASLSNSALNYWFRMYLSLREIHSAEFIHYLSLYVRKLSHLERYNDARKAMLYGSYSDTLSSHDIEQFKLLRSLREKLLLGQNV